MANKIRLRFQPDNLDITVTLDVSQWMGDMLEELEAHLDEPVLAWARRMGETFTRGFRVQELRATDLIALAYLGVAPSDLATSWLSVSRRIAPYTMELLPLDEATADEVAADEVAEQPAPQRVSPVVEALAQKRAEAAAAIGMPDVVLPPSPAEQ